MISMFVGFLKSYFSKIITVLTFFLIWCGYLIIFNNSVTLNILLDLTIDYSEEDFNNKLLLLKKYQNRKLYLYVGISVFKCCIYFNLLSKFF